MKCNAIKWLYKTPEKKKLYILGLIIIQAINGLTGVFYAILLRNIVDNATNHNENEFWKNVLFIISLVILQLILRALIRWLNELSRATIENIFKHRMFKYILDKNYEKINSIHSGEWINRLTNDTKVIADGYVEIIPGMIGTAIKLISAVVMICIIDINFSYIIIPSGIIMLITTYFLRKKMKNLHKKIQEKDGNLRIFFQDHITNLLMVHSFAVEKQTLNAADEKMKEHKKARMKRNIFYNFGNMGYGCVINGLYLVGVCYCGYGILINIISFGTLTAITQLISQIQSPVANITGYIPKFYSMLASAERLMEIENFENEIDKELYDYKYINNYYNKNMKAIELKNIEYTYFKTANNPKEISKDDMPVVIKNINLTIKRGETIAFVGHSGCGKSTILKILMGIFKIDKGKINIIDVKDSKKEFTSKWRRLFAYVPQGNGIMSGSIKDIVSFCEEKQDIDRINTALKISCADEFVNELKDNIDTVLGERGLGLSEGQIQRISIARAIYSQSPILILDEATSALDIKTEEKLLENLKNMTDKTVIIVTHHKAVMEKCDKIFEL